MEDSGDQSNEDEVPIMGKVVSSSEPDMTQEVEIEPPDTDSLAETIYDAKNTPSLQSDDSAEGPPVVSVAPNEDPSTSEEEIPTAKAVRVGSPFAVEPENLPGPDWQAYQQKPELFYDIGPLKYTAIGAVAAAVMTLGFAAAAAWWFPGGGTMIAALGCVLSIFGLYSPHKLYAAGCLTLHLVLFLLSFGHATIVA